MILLGLAAGIVIQYWLIPKWFARLIVREAERRNAASHDHPSGKENNE